MKEQENVERYLRGEMNDIEKSAFEANLQHDENLKNAVEFQRQLIEQLKSRANAEQQINAAKEELAQAEGNKGDWNEETASQSELETTLVTQIRTRALVEEQIMRAREEMEEERADKQMTISMRPRRKLIGYVTFAAAMIAGVVMIWQPTQLSNDAFVEKYAGLVPTSTTISTTTNDLVRGNYTLIEGMTAQESEIAIAAIKQIAARDYPNAEKLLQSIESLHEKNARLYFYLGLSRLLQKKDCVGIFEELNRDNVSFGADVLYYLSLAYIQNGNLSKAKTAIQKMQALYPHQSSLSKAMLKELRWF
jgi:hypothetical protein